MKKKRIAIAQKETILKARVTREMHELLERLAEESGESMSYILRRAIRDYAEKHGGADHAER
jgi:predicted DNA-binding protein